MFLQIKDIIAKNSSKTQISTPHIYTTVKRIQEQLQKITRDDLSKPPLNINEKDISDTYYYIQAGIDNAAHILISLRDNT